MRRRRGWRRKRGRGKNWRKSKRFLKRSSLFSGVALGLRGGMHDEDVPLGPNIIPNLLRYAKRRRNYRLKRNPEV